MNFANVIFAISILSPFDTGHSHFLKNKIESPLPKESSLVEIGPVVLEKKILNFRQCNLAILLLSPLGKGHGPSFEQT